MSEKTTQQSTQNSSGGSRPLSEQFSYLQDAWNRAQGLYNNSQGNQYSGDMLAQLTPEQVSNYRNMYNFAQNSNIPQYSANVASKASALGDQFASQGQQYATQAGGLYDRGGDIVNRGVNLTGRGAGSTFSSIDRLNAYRPEGGVDENIAAAGKYADNPYISGQVDAAMRDARRQVSEQALPQIAREASLTGNIGSSKRGIAEGIVERGLADAGADVSSNLRGQAYSQGLNLSEQGRQFNSNALLDAMKSAGSLGSNLASIGVGQTGAGTGVINAGTGVANVGLGYQNAGLSARNLGLNANQMQLAQQAGLFDLANQAGSGLQSGNQTSLDNARLRSEYGDDRSWNNLAKYYGIVGNLAGQQTYGNQTGTQTQTTNPSAWSVGAGLLGAGTGLFGSKGLNWLSRFR